MAASVGCSASFGGVGFSPPLIGDAFIDQWQKFTVRDLALVIQETMPADEIATLSSSWFDQMRSEPDFWSALPNHPLLGGSSS